MTFDILDIVLVATCVVLALLPPNHDPAIRIKEWQISKGYHPESPEQ